MTYFVKQVGSEIHDIHNKPFTLKGVGIGSWLLIEGYMLKSFGDIDRPRRFQSHIQKMTSKTYHDLFFQKWHQTFFTKEDIQFIKSSGFNSIRIPIDYQFLFEANTKQVKLKPKKQGFKILDDIISLCEKHQVYIILDMHGAPGGQTGTNIDNSENNEPLLFKEPIYQKQLCYIWKVIAKRYQNVSYIACYDLLNEPLPNWFSDYNNQLIPLYRRIIKEIRSVDKNHMITLEGLHWSTNLEIFTDRLDNNLLLQFHKYWSNPDTESIKEYLTLRDTLSLPLFMGEGGENNLPWYYAVFKLYDQHNISFNFWTYKKMDTHNSPVSIKKPRKWTSFLEGTLNKKESEHVLNELLNNIQFNNCIINQPVINQVLQKDNLVIPAYGYDYNGKHISYNSISKQPSSLRKTDNLCITDIDNNIITPNFKQYGGEDYLPSEKLVVHLEVDEWVIYSFDITSSNRIIQIEIDALPIDNAEIYFDGFKLKSTKSQEIKTLESGEKHLRIKAIKPIKIYEIKITTIK